MSSGLSVRQVAQTGQFPRLRGGGMAATVFHSMMDGAGIVGLGGGGYVYVSNSEIGSGAGGAYGLYFDEDGEVTDYRALLAGTSRNCGGGLTPWNTWVSCEESSGGHCWQVDPDPESAHHATPMRTLLGGSGGRYETVVSPGSLPSVLLSSRGERARSARGLVANAAANSLLVTLGCFRRPLITRTRTGRYSS